MARRLNGRDISPVLEAARSWIDRCLIEDGSVFSQEALWTSTLGEKVHQAFVDHPDTGPNDFLAKLRGQMQPASPPAKQLMAEFLWVLLLFPSNIRAQTKRQQVCEAWGWSGQHLPDNHPKLSESILAGVGSGGPGFNTYRPDELAFLISLTHDLKSRDREQRQLILKDYNRFMEWISETPQQGHRQFRHMLRYFAFPDQVERIASNNDRQKILEEFGIGPSRHVRGMSDGDLDTALFTLRRKLEADYSGSVLDFYEPPLKAMWSRDGTVKTPAGEVTVTVPSDDDEQDDVGAVDGGIASAPDPRQSLTMQASLADIGAIMGFKIWIPRSDRGRVRELALASSRVAFLEDLPLNYDTVTLDTVEQIDVLWLKGRSIARAFEVEHTTAVYSGLLRMADLLALQPNMDIRLHIVAPSYRREKVFREMLRPVFSLLDRGPLSRSCTFISYENVSVIRNIGHLAHTSDSVLSDYEEKAVA